MSSVDKIHKIIANGIAWTIRHPDDPRKTSGDVKAYFEMRRLQRQGLGRFAKGVYAKARKERQA